MDTVLFVSATIGFSENLFLVLIVLKEVGLRRQLSADFSNYQKMSTHSIYSRP